MGLGHQQYAFLTRIGSVNYHSLLPSNKKQWYAQINHSCSYINLKLTEMLVWDGVKILRAVKIDDIYLLVFFWFTQEV